MSSSTSPSTSSSVTLENLRKKLNSLTNAQESIQALSYWVIHHKNNYRQIVDTWLDVFKECKSSRMKLTLLYLANDVIQNSKRKGTTVFVDSYKNVLEDAASLCQDDTIKKNVLRLFKIWGERGVYEKEFCEKLDAATGKKETAPKKPPKPKVDAKFLAEFQPEEVPDAIEELASYEDEVEFKFKQLSSMNLDVTSVDTISQLKDRAGGKRFSQHFEDAADRLEEFVLALDKEVQMRTHLVELLEKSEIFYDAQMGEAKIVANAYKNFATRVTSLKKRLDDYKKVLPANDLSPLPSPASDAPSPGATPPQEADGVNREIEDMELSDAEEDGGKIIAAIPTKSHSSRSRPLGSKISSGAKKRHLSSSKSSRHKVPTTNSSGGEQIPSLSPKVPVVTTPYTSSFSYLPLSTAQAPLTGQAYTPTTAGAPTTQAATSYTPTATASYNPSAAVQSYTPSTQSYTPATTQSYTPVTTTAYSPLPAVTPAPVYTPSVTVPYTSTPSYVPSAPQVYVPSASSVYTPSAPSVPQPYTPTVSSVTPGYTPTDGSATQQYVPEPSSPVVPYSPTGPAAAPTYPPAAGSSGQPYTPAPSTVPYTPTAPGIAPVYTPPPPPPPPAGYMPPTSSLGQEFTPLVTPAYTPTNTAVGQTYSQASPTPVYTPTAPAMAPTFPVARVTEPSSYAPPESSNYPPSAAPGVYESGMPQAPAPYNPPVPPPAPPLATPPGAAPPPIPAYTTPSSPPYNAANSAAYDPAATYNPAASPVYTPQAATTSAYEPPSSPPYNTVYSASYNPIPPAEPNRPEYSYTNQYSRSDSNGDSYDPEPTGFNYSDVPKSAPAYSPPPVQEEDYTRSVTPTRDENSQGEELYKAPAPLPESLLSLTNQPPTANPMQFLTNLISSRVTAGEPAGSTNLLGNLTSLTGVKSSLVSGQLGGAAFSRKPSSKILVEEKASGKRVTSTNAFGRSRTNTDPYESQREDDTEDENIELTEEEKEKVDRANQSFGLGMFMMQMSNQNKPEQEETEHFENDELEAPDIEEAITLPKESVEIPDPSVTTPSPKASLAPWTQVKPNFGPLMSQNDAPTSPSPPPPPSSPPPPPPPPASSGALQGSLVPPVPFAAMLLPPPPPSSAGPPPPPPPPQATAAVNQPEASLQGSDHLSAQPIKTITHAHVPVHPPSRLPISMVGQAMDATPSPPPAVQPIQSIIGGHPYNAQRISVIGQQSYGHHEEPKPVPVLGQQPRIRGPFPGPPPGPPPPTAKQLSGSGIRAPGPPPGPPPVSAKRMANQDATAVSSTGQQPASPVSLTGNANDPVPPPVDGQQPTSPNPSQSMDATPISQIPSLVSTRSRFPLRRPNLTPEVPPAFPEANVKPLKSILKRPKPSNSQSNLNNSAIEEDDSSFAGEAVASDTDLRIPVLGSSTSTIEPHNPRDVDFRISVLGAQRLSTEGPSHADVDLRIPVVGSHAPVHNILPSIDVDLRTPLDSAKVPPLMEDLSVDSNIPVVGAGGAAGSSGNISPRMSHRPPFQGNRPRSPGAFRFDRSPGRDREHKPFIEMDYGHGRAGKRNFNQRRLSHGDDEHGRQGFQDFDFDLGDSNSRDYGHGRPRDGGILPPHPSRRDHHSLEDPYSPRGLDLHPKFEPERMRQFEHRHRPDMRPRPRSPRFGQFRPNFRGRSPQNRPRQPFFY